MTDTTNLSKREFVFFWGGYLSNWYSSSFIDPKTQLQFSNNEQWMMYQKAKLFGDDEMALKILAEPNPKKNKKFGRQVKGFNESIWAKNACEIVIMGCELKFSQNPTLLSQLLKTQDKELVEASPYDKIWGIGLSEKLALKIPPEKWPGQNLLGKCLVKVRSKLRLSA